VTLSSPANGLRKFWHCLRLIVADLLTGKRASRAHIGGMDQILPPELNDLEFEALRQLAAHPTTHHATAAVRVGQTRPASSDKPAWVVILPVPEEDARLVALRVVHEN
jgi:hypothetical protein